ncbi:MAG: antitoxin [Thermoanaerobaculia bacterium]|nr:antitoxin [Thermoanaerobaculia bacterium]
MTRTQIQLPDALYTQAKKLAKQQEISLAELVRRGLEHMLRLHPLVDEEAEWSLPKPRDLGECLVPVEQWREIANMVRFEADDD